MAFCPDMTATFSGRHRAGCAAALSPAPERSIQTPNLGLGRAHRHMYSWFFKIVFAPCGLCLQMQSTLLHTLNSFYFSIQFNKQQNVPDGDVHPGDGH